MLLFALERSRAQFAWKCGGLDAAGLRAPHPPSAMTLGGLIKHLALVEDQFTAEDLGGPPYGRQWYDYDGPRLGVAVGGRRLARGALRALARRGGALPGGVGAGARRREGSTSRRSASPARASPRTCAACWSTCTTSTPATSATRTCFREATDGLVGEDPPQS